jgi:regulatory protein
LKASKEGVPPSATRSCYDRAGELLAARPHFRRELAAKLLRRGYPPPEVDEALQRLARQGYLDDTETARGFVAARQQRGALGRPRLRAELERRGAAAEAIATVLAELPEDDLAAASAAARRWHGRTPDALARHLARKGFSRRAIFAVLNEHRAGAGPSTAASDEDAPESPGPLRPQRRLPRSDDEDDEGL